MGEDGLRKLPRAKAEPRDGRVHTERVVAFLDLLGAKKLQDSISFLNSLGSAINEERQLISSWPTAKERDFRTLWFSDNLGASAPTTGLPMEAGRQSQGRAFDAVAWYVGSVQARFLADHGLASRGGLAIGDCFHNDTMIFGPALVDAYVTESKVAEVPRILLHPTAGPCCEGSVVPTRDDGDGKGPYLDFIRIGLPDGDAMRVHYLTRARSSIVGGPSTIDADNEKRRDDMLASWQWLASYFDDVRATLDLGSSVPVIGDLPRPW